MNEGPEFGFGKFKGKKCGYIPIYYLKWIVEKSGCRREFKREVAGHIKLRDKSYEHPTLRASEKRR